MVTPTIDPRVKMLFQRRLINPSPFAATSRFTWVGMPRYIDPSWYPGESVSVTNQRVNPQSPTWRVYAKPAKGVVRPLRNPPATPAPTRFVKLP
jgi:hypothetical protein